MCPRGYARFQLRTGTVGVQVRIVLPEALNYLVDNVKIATPDEIESKLKELEELVAKEYDTILSEVGEQALEGESNESG